MNTIETWLNAIVPLMDDDALYRAESRKAQAASAAFDRDVLRPQYDAFFRGMLGKN